MRLGSAVTALLLVGCGAAAEEPASASSTGEEVTAIRTRIGIPTELRPENRAEEPATEEPATEEPATGEPANEEPVAEEPEPESEPEPEPEPVVEPAPEIASWEYLREARRHVAHTYREDIQRCFDEGHARAGPLSGRLVIAMVPHGDGRVASSRVVENGTDDAEVGDCVMRAARTWELPRPPRQTLEVQLRFIV